MTIREAQIPFTLTLTPTTVDDVLADTRFIATDYLGEAFHTLPEVGKATPGEELYSGTLIIAIGTYSTLQNISMPDGLIKTLTTPTTHLCVHAVCSRNANVTLMCRYVSAIIYVGLLRQELLLLSVLAYLDMTILRTKFGINCARMKWATHTFMSACRHMLLLRVFM